jgi:hypothetical protein
MKINEIRGIAILLIGIVVILSTGCRGSEGPTGPQGAIGPQGEPGPAGVQGPPGEDGNANVTLHIFDGHNFSGVPNLDLCLGDNISEEEMLQSSWQVYLGAEIEEFGLIYWHIPGAANASEYGVITAYDAEGVICIEELQPQPQPFVEIGRMDGPGEEYDEIRIIQVAASNVVDHRNNETNSLVPDNLDLTDYKAVLDYFGSSISTVNH